MHPRAAHPRPSSRARSPIATVVSLAILCAALQGCGGSGADTATTSMLLPDQIGEWVRQDSSDTYDRETIFDYINGAGEVYRSYAFKDVLVARYAQGPGNEITVELFDMGTAEDAYGVFSYARESEEVGIGGGFERKGRVLCFWQNRYYVCVAAESSTDAQPVLEEIARGVSNQLPPASDPPPLLGALPTEDLIPASDRYFHTHQSLNYHYYLARENVLELNAGTNVVLARYRPGSTYLVIAQYGNDSGASHALSAFREQYQPDKEEHVSSEAWGRFLVVVLDAQSGTDANRLLQATIDRIQELAD